MYKKWRIIKNNRGISPVLETLVAVGICLSLLAIFFIATTNIFSTHEREDVDLEAKCTGIMEALVNSPGVASGYNSEWENNPASADFAGLATTRTIAYGNATISNQGEVTITSYHNFSDSRVGIAETCFLAGTKIVLANESYKNIEDIKIGDMVKSFDDKTGKIADEKVTNVFHHSPAEMGDYYLVINKQLKVTPNHMFYSNGNWICASDLKIGDPLFYKSSDYKICSIDKIFEKEPTYNFEVEGNHNYFVALDKTDVLVHNANTNPGDGDTQGGSTTHYGSPTADFTWFDSDGPYRGGQIIFFNAEKSHDNPDLLGQKGYIKWYNWWWKWGEIGQQFENTSEYCYHNFSDNGVHYVRLTVIDDSGLNDTCIYTVQANKPAAYEMETKPWILTSKNIYPETGNKTFTAYDENHYIKYTSVHGNNYIFEIKEKNKPEYIILDSEKIQGLSGVIYYYLKSALGFNTTTSQINFNISIVSESGVYYYGANYSNTDVLRSDDKKILIYHAPEMQGTGVKPPYYEEGEITVRAFIGGVIPNYPPNPPINPYPGNGSTNANWNDLLRWTSGGDINGDPLTYDVYFGISSSPPFKETIGPYPASQTSISYDPGIIMKPPTPYYWKIVVWDDHGAKAEGPIWHFTTNPNDKPNIPTNPTPTNGEMEVNVTAANLTWTCSDPNQGEGDRLCYEVNFSKNPLLLQKISCDNLTRKYWDPKKTCGSPDKKRLDYNTTYYWNITANDTCDAHTPGPIWSFTTAEKGIDQYCIYGSGAGEDTSKMLGQTFRANRTGDLTKIKLSLKNCSHSGQDYITVRIYECPRDPNDLGNLLGTAIIPNFNDTSFIWKEADFNTTPPIRVEKDMPYFIVVDAFKGKKLYSWQYNPALGPVGSSYSYPDGNGWKSYDGNKWFPIKNPPFGGDDFIFKTYVFRDFKLDQYDYVNSKRGETTGSGLRIALAQTFTAGQNGDLMKVSLSINKSGGQITVRIYDKLPTTTIEWNNYLANTTIKSFNSGGTFINKSANFTENPAYLVRGNKYYIVIPTVTGYELEWNKHEGAMYCTPGFPWRWNPLQGGGIGFNFETYMDDIY